MSSPDPRCSVLNAIGHHVEPPGTPKLFRPLFWVLAEIGSDDVTSRSHPSTAKDASAT